MDTIFIFWIVVALILGGVVLLHPLMQHLGAAMEEWLRLRRGGAEGERLRVEHLEARLQALEDEQARVLERQEFLEALFEPPEPPALGSSEDDDGRREG